MTKNKTQKNEFRYAGVVDYGDGIINRSDG